MNYKQVKELLEEHWYANHVYFYVDHDLKHTCYASGLEGDILNWIPSDAIYSSKSLFLYWDDSKDEEKIRKWLGLEA